MITTLVRELESIEKIPDDVAEVIQIDKKTAYRRLLDNWRKEYPLIDSAAKGKVSILDTVDELLEPYKGRRLFLPTSESEEYRKELEELRLNELLGGLFFERGDTYLSRAINWIGDKCMNPTVMTPATGVLLALMFGGFGRFESEIVNYSVAFGIGAFAGVVFGLLGSWIRYESIDRVRNDAESLDTIIQEAYMT